MTNKHLQERVDRIENLVRYLIEKKYYGQPINLETMEEIMDWSGEKSNEK